MGRLLGFLGLVLIFAAVAYLLFVLGVFGEERANDLLLMFVCDEHDSLVSRSGVFGGSGLLVINERPVDYYCVDNEGQETNITGQVALLMTGGFASMLVSGIGLTILGSFMAVSNFRKDLPLSYGTGVTPTIGGQAVQSNLTGNTSVGSGIQGASLSERLQQLEEARQQGLISSAEYQRTRQAILDSMDD